MTPTLSTPELIRAVNAVPEGQTARQIAERFPGAKVSRVSWRLGQAAMYGKIDREFKFTPINGIYPQRWCVYRPKEKASA